MPHPTDNAPPVYEPATLTVIGTVHELTLGCDKNFGGTDGFTFNQQPIMCNGS